MGPGIGWGFILRKEQSEHGGGLEKVVFPRSLLSDNHPSIQDKTFFEEQESNIIKAEPGDDGAEREKNVR